MLQLLGILLQADGAVNEPSRSFTVSGEAPKSLLLVVSLLNTTIKA